MSVLNCCAELLDDQLPTGNNGPVGFERGAVQVLVHRLETQRLPDALDLKAKVDRGELLNDIEIEALEEILSDVDQIKPLLDRNPKWQPLASRMASLYSDITTRALENEQNKS